MGALILVSNHDGWREITLNRPDRLNAFNDEMHLELHAALTSAAENPLVRAVLLTGAGRGFCAGQDLASRDPSKMQAPPDLEHTLTTLFNPLVSLIRAIEKPVICGVNGVAAGAGANLALACDIVLASEKAKFIQSFAKVGLIPDAGGTWSLTHLVGPARAKALAMTGEPLPAQTAVDWGLIWKAYPEDMLMEKARALTAELATAATFGLAQTKKAIHAAGGNDFDTQAALEARLQGECGRTPDYREGVTAFLEKRPANFTGQA